MNFVVAGFLAMVGLALAGCSTKPTKEVFFAREAECLKSYCTGDASTAEAALLGCAQYAEQCQRAGVEGIPYDEVFARIYGRLYLVERHLGHSVAAEEYLVRYAHYHAVASTLARKTGHPYGEMARLIENKFDHGLRTVWKTNQVVQASHSTPLHH